MPDIEHGQYVGQTRYPTDNPVVTERPVAEPEADRREALSEEQEQRSMEFVAGGSMLEAIAGVAAAVLGILGLIGVVPGVLCARADRVRCRVVVERRSG